MYWGWFKGGCALGIVFLLAVLLVKPIGVSTQFVIFNGLVGSLADDSLVVKDDKSKSGYSSSNPYLNKSGGKYAKSAANPINYSFIFVLAMFVGGLAAKLASKSDAPTSGPVPDYHRERFGESAMSRYLMAFAGGILVLFGARLAGGCTSGHMMSGMMQTAISGYVFALATFAAAVPAARFLYKKS